MNKHWVGRFAWPGRRPFWYGNVLVRAEATLQEVEAALTAQLQEHLPEGSALPATVDMVPGMLVLREGE